MTTKMITKIPMALVCLFLFSAFTLQSNYRDGEVNRTQMEEERAAEHQAAFEEFLALFPDTLMPLSMTVQNFEQELVELNKSLEEAKTKSLRSEEFKELEIPERFIPEIRARAFSRMGPIEVEPVAKVSLQQNFIAVIYKTYRSRYAQSRYEINMRVYNQKGEMVNYPFVDNKKQQKLILKKKKDYISAVVLGWRSNYDIQTFQINKDGFIKMDVWKVKYEKETKKHGVTGNTISHYDWTESRYIQVKPDGGIQQIKAEELEKC